MSERKRRTNNIVEVRFNLRGRDMTILFEQLAACWGQPGANGWVEPGFVFGAGHVGG